MAIRIVYDDLLFTFFISMILCTCLQSIYSNFTIEGISTVYKLFH